MSKQHWKKEPHCSIGGTLLHDFRREMLLYCSFGKLLDCFEPSIFSTVEAFHLWPVWFCGQEHCGQIHTRQTFINKAAVAELITLAHKTKVNLPSCFQHQFVAPSETPCVPKHQSHSIAKASNISHLQIPPPRAPKECALLRDSPCFQAGGKAT